MSVLVKETQQVELDMPQKYHMALESVLNEHAGFFRCQLGRTNVTKHVIGTGDSAPVKLPPSPISFHY